MVLFHLAAPDPLEAVEPFLFNLFPDPDIIPLGPFGILRLPIAKLISARRAIPVAGKYAEIGGGSPVGRVPERERGRLGGGLSPSTHPRARPAQGFWPPITPPAGLGLPHAAPP